MANHNSWDEHSHTNCQAFLTHKAGLTSLLHCLKLHIPRTLQAPSEAAAMATAIYKSATEAFANLTGSTQRQKQRYGDISGLDQVVAEHDELR